MSGKWIESLLFGTISTDPAVFSGVVVLLCAVALVAGLLLAVVVNDLPSHQVAIERGASPVVGDSVGDVIEPHRLPRRWRVRWWDAGFFGRLLSGREFLPKNKPNPMSDVSERFGIGTIPVRRLSSPNIP